MYELKVLSNEEFDNLPGEETRGSDISNSLGFANRMTGRAYIRQTGIHDLNKYLLSHELEELESDHSTHEDENGIRHKRFGDAMRTFYNPLGFPGMGPLSPKQQKPDMGGMEGRPSYGNIPFSGQMGTRASSNLGGGLSAGPDSEYATPGIPNMGGSSGSRSISASGGSRNQSAPYGMSASSPEFIGMHYPQNQGLFSGFNPGFGSGFDIGQSQQSQQQISPDVLERLKGFYSGRVTF